MPKLKLSARSKNDLSPLTHMMDTSVRSSESSAASVFSPATIAISIKPLPRYPLRLEPFPPLLGLIAYVCDIDYALDINEEALERILHGVEREFIKYHQRTAHIKSTRPSHDQILGYLNFILLTLDELFEDPALNKKMIENNSKIYQLFSNALSSFLKNTRSPEAMDDFLLKEYSAEIGDDKPIVIPSKPKLSETGRRLLGHIKANKIYEVGTLLRNKPEVAIEWDQTMTILTDAAFNGHVGILELIITTLRDLALEENFQRIIMDD